jgi:GntR family histidine utilization transcriptional repressor
MLQLETRDKAFHIVIIHRENGTPIQLEERYVTTTFAPQCLSQDFTLITPSAYLSSIAPLQEAEHIVRAEMPQADVRSHLDMGDKEPCLVVIRRTWAHGRVVSYAHLHHPASRYELTGHYAPPGFRKSAEKPALAARLETSR